MNFIKAGLSSWGTTSVAIGALITMLAVVWPEVIAITDGDPETVPDLDAVYIAVVAALSTAGFFQAKDAVKE